MTVSKAKQDSNRRWDKANYDQILIKVPKGTKELIRQTGTNSINGYIKEAIYTKLQFDGITLDSLPPSPDRAESVKHD